MEEQDQTTAPVSDDQGSEEPKMAPKAGGDDSNRRLFVGGISWGTTDEGLKSAFAQFGSVESAQVITDKMTGRSKGFGFVVMGSEAEAQAAIEKMNGQLLEGRQITVNVARPKTDSPRPPRRY